MEDCLQLCDQVEGQKGPGYGELCAVSLDLYCKKKEKAIKKY